MVANGDGSEWVAREESAHRPSKQNTRNFFVILDLHQDFLKKDLGNLAKNATYITAEEIAKSLTVTNDNGVAITQEYNGLLSKTEEQMLLIMQIVRDACKCTVVEGLVG